MPHSEQATAKPNDRFLTLPEICRRAGYKPSTIHNYRALGKSDQLKLPAIIKRGDGRLGCLESELNKYLLEHYGGEVRRPLLRVV